MPADVLFTVTVFVVVHPVPSEYVIVTVPEDKPVTIPLSKLMIAIVELLLLHVPPVVASLNTLVVPAHRPVDPVIGAAPGLLNIVIV